MNLSDFVRDSLVEICIGVFEAKNDAKFAICPGNLIFEDKTEYKCTEMQMVEFDLATTVVNEISNGQYKAGISIVGVGIRVEGDTTNKITNNETSRIKFSIPVAFNAKMAGGGKNG